jgi:hypothetical protein
VMQLPRQQLLEHQQQIDQQQGSVATPTTVIRTTTEGVLKPPDTPVQFVNGEEDDSSDDEVEITVKIAPIKHPMPFADAAGAAPAPGTGMSGASVDISTSTGIAALPAATTTATTAATTAATIAAAVATDSTSASGTEITVRYTDRGAGPLFDCMRLAYFRLRYPSLQDESALHPVLKQCPPPLSPPPPHPPRSCHRVSGSAAS